MIDSELYWNKENAGINWDTPYFKEVGTFPKLHNGGGWTDIQVIEEEL